MTRGNSTPAWISTACPSLPCPYDEQGEAESTHIRKKNESIVSSDCAPRGAGLCAATQLGHELQDQTIGNVAPGWNLCSSPVICG